MAITEEEAKRYRDQITKLVAAATPDPSLPYGERVYKGALGAHFQKLDTDLRVQMKANNIKEPEIVAAIAQRQASESQQIIETYMNGIAKPAAGSEAEGAGAVTQAASLLGIGGDGITGFLMTQVAKLGAVGEVALAAFKMMGSAFNSLLGMVGIGDPNARMIGFGEARQQVRDSQAYANGSNALFPILNTGNAALLAELQNGSGTLGEIARIADNDRSQVKNTGMSRENTIAFLKNLKEGKSEKPFGPGQKMAELLAAKPDMVPDGAKVVVLTMPDNSLGLAIGTLSADTTTFTVTSIIQQKGEALVASAPPADMKPISTGLTPPPPTLQQSLNASKLVEQTLSDNVADLRARIAAIRSGEGALALPPEALTKLNASLNLLPADDKRFANMQSIVVVLPDKTPAILSGRLNADTGQFQPVMVTVAGEDSKPPVSRMVSGLNMVKVTPTLDGTRLVSNTKTEVKAADLAKSLAAQPGMEKLGAALTQALTDENHPLRLIEADLALEGKVRSTAVLLPGNKPVIITSVVADDKGNLAPIYMTELNARGELQLPKRVAGSPPISPTNGRTVTASKDEDLNGLVTPDIAKSGVAKALKDLGSEGLSGLPPVPSREALDQVRQMLPGVMDFLRGGARR